MIKRVCTSLTTTNQHHKYSQNHNWEIGKIKMCSIIEARVMGGPRRTKTASTQTKKITTTKLAENYSEWIVIRKRLLIS
jgi:hypothetical protein